MSPNIQDQGSTSKPNAFGGASFLQRIALSAPFAIAVYVIGLATLRISFSPFLEVDESEFVGLVDLRLIYENAHPPLFNWLTRLVLELTGWDWALSLAIVRYGALGLFHWFVFDSARRLAGGRTALLALCVSAFLPQVLWMSAVTLAHTTLAMALAAATLNMMIRAFEEPTLKRYAILGGVAGLGMLTKFSFPLFVVPFVAACALEPELRYAFRNRRNLLAGLGVFALLTLPMVIAALLNLEDAASRTNKLYSGSAFSIIDPPYVGVDGLLSMIVAAIAWAGLAVAAWTGARAYDQSYGPLRREEHPFAPVIGRAMLYGLAGMAALVLITDVHKIEERYLTPLLAALPIYLAVGWPLKRSAGYFAAAAGLLFLLVLPAFALMVRFDDRNRYAIPYDQLSRLVWKSLERAPGAEAGLEGPFPIIASRHDDEANLTLAFGWPGATSPSKMQLEDYKRALVIWRGDGEAPVSLAPEDFGPETKVQSVRLELANDSGGEILWSFQLFERLRLDAGPTKIVGEAAGEDDASRPAEVPAAPVEETPAESDVDAASDANAESEGLDAPPLQPARFTSPPVVLEQVEPESLAPLNAANIGAQPQD